MKLDSHKNLRQVLCKYDATRKKMASAKIITAWISFCQLKTSRIRATFTKITHTFENESKKKNGLNFYATLYFTQNKINSKLISDLYFQSNILEFLEFLKLFSI